MLHESIKIAIIGLGYVSLPLAVEFGKLFLTLGFDINAERIAELQVGSDRKLETTPAKLVTTWLSERKDQIEVCYLPRYSPEINPEEYLNRDIKTELCSSDRATSNKALLHNATSFMERLVKMPERVMAFFKISAAQYAALPSN